MTIYEILTLGRPYSNVPPGLIPGIGMSLSLRLLSLAEKETL